MAIDVQSPLYFDIYDASEPAIKASESPCCTCDCALLFFQEIALWTVAGVCLSLVGVPIVVGVVLGASLAVINHIFIRIVNKKTTATEILDLIEKIGQGDGPLLKVIRNIRKVIAGQSIFFFVPHEHHKLHSDITLITDTLSQNFYFQNIGRVFLNALDGMPVQYSDGTWLHLDLSVEKARLRHGPISFYIELLDTNSASFIRDFEQLRLLELECFGASMWPLEYIRDKFFPDPNNGSFVARAPNGQILAYLFYECYLEKCDEFYVSGKQVKEWRIHIAALGRKANVAKLQLGDQLLQHILQKYFRQCEFVLEVREGNIAAIAIYQKMGFRQVNRNPTYYDNPPEAAIQMRLDWDAFPVLTEVQ